MNPEAMRATAVLVGGERNGRVVDKPWIQPDGSYLHPDPAPGYKFAEFNYGDGHRQSFGYPATMNEHEASRLATERFKHLLVEDFLLTTKRRLGKLSVKENIEFYELVRAMADSEIKRLNDICDNRNHLSR